MNRLFATINKNPFTTFVMALSAVTLGGMYLTDSYDPVTAMAPEIAGGVSATVFLWDLIVKRKEKVM